MSTRRVIEMWYDVNSEMLRASLSGESLRVEKFPWITFNEKPVVNLTLVKDYTLAPYALPTTDMSYEAAVDNVFSTSPMCKTLDGGINQPGDWGDGGNANPAVGQISIKLNAANSVFLSRLSSKVELIDTKLELVVTEISSGDTVRVYWIPMRTKNLLTFSGSVPDPTGNFVWFTDPDTGASCLRIVNEDGEVLMVLKPVGV